MSEQKNGGVLYGTIDHKGQILLKPQFEKIVELDPENGISHIKKER